LPTLANFSTKGSPPVPPFLISLNPTANAKSCKKFLTFCIKT
jgi:hypothetical protein